MSDAQTTASAGRWIPLECNPEVLTLWAKKAGLITSQTQFEDIYGLDDELLGMVPQPVKAVILLFPLNGSIIAKRQDEDAKIKAEGQPISRRLYAVDAQIGNTCSTMALLPSLHSPVAFVPESPLAKFIDQCQEHAHLLETTPLFTNIHAETANTGQTSAVEADMNTDLHFTVFVSAPEAEFRKMAKSARDNASGMRLVELDGGRVGPIDRGPCNDLLTDVANYVKKEYITSSSSVQFSMLALALPS
ncbi:cysteine proteinase [Pleurotus eryngii]|uniref:Ubiquitin carboxyl-terminal hydrolase n=1 Tax=Pleurotus eryngii TaxID=5323 RepID=A0A9P6DAI8_PLEER|nr:cysteine proteinase [Pleurotus eryngii]